MDDIFTISIASNTRVSSQRFLTGMGSDEGRSHQASRPLPNTSCLRERHDAVDADLRR